MSAGEHDAAGGLVLDGLSHAFAGLAVVREVSLSVKPGEILCLLGPSGCGKTTVLRIAAGLETPQRGRVLIDGREVVGPERLVPAEARNVGLMFQDFALFPHLKAIDNVAFGLFDLPSAQRRQAAREALERVGMAGAADSYPHTLSGGEQQRVALARAMASRPRVMLLDEPFSGLDVRLRDHIRADTASLLKDAGTTTLMVTHDPEEAMLMADRIALMKDGRVLQEGAPIDLYRHPNSPFCASFLGETNRLEGFIKSGHAETALGVFATEGLAEGSPVEVHVRPEGLSLGTAETALTVPATVIDARGLGAFARVRLRLGDEGPEVTVRIADFDLPRPGSCVTLRADPAMVFVFPLGER